MESVHDLVSRRSNLIINRSHPLRRSTAGEPRALAIRERVLGQEHPHVATSLNNLAALYHAQGHPAEAYKLEVLAKAIRDKRVKEKP